MTTRVTWGRAKITLEGGESFEGRARLEQNTLTVVTVNGNQPLLSRAVSTAKRQGGGRTWTLMTDEGQVTVRKINCCG